MNMQQRKYLLKDRLKPMQQEINVAARHMALSFKPYVSWGEFVRMIKTGELQLSVKYYHKPVASGYITAGYDNPFGDKGVEMLPKRSGVEVDSVVRDREMTEWEQRFKHSTDFLMLASEDTIIALLHNLEKSVKEYVERANAHKEKVNAEAEAYVKWLNDQGAKHSYDK